MNDLLHEFVENFRHNLFKPLLLFFYAGFLVPILGVKLEFPKQVYQGLTIYLLLAIGWHGGEELAGLESEMYKQALGFMVIGFITNTIIGFLAYGALRAGTRVRCVDAATVAGYYGSDSAGTFVTALGVLTTAQIAFAPYMPVMLAVMEIPGCLVALYLVSRMRRMGMDTAGYMPNEAGYNQIRQRVVATSAHGSGEAGEAHGVSHREQELVTAGAAAGRYAAAGSSSSGNRLRSNGENGTGLTAEERREAVEVETALALESEKLANGKDVKTDSWISPEMLHEVFLNPGIFLLFAGIAIGFIGRIQGASVTNVDDSLFVTLFHGMLCVFLLEMGMTASSKLKDLRTAGWQFVLFALVAPNIFATMHDRRSYLQQRPGSTIRHRNLRVVRCALWCRIVYRGSRGPETGNS